MKKGIRKGKKKLKIEKTGVVYGEETRCLQLNTG